MTVHSLSHKSPVRRSFRVRVAIPGVAPYSYDATATASFDLWLAVYERVINEKPNLDFPPSITITRK